jgi:hypothetical protein
MESIIIKTNSTSSYRERAAMLAKSIKNSKKRGDVAVPHEPIEGKIFW